MITRPPTQGEVAAAFIASYEAIPAYASGYDNRTRLYLSHIIALLALAEVFPFSSLTSSLPTTYTGKWEMTMRLARVCADNCWRPCFDAARDTLTDIRETA